ncbi:DUF3659 domain-containing protein [Mucilaginibacter sp. HMF5004]|uniref:DUF3659 domain-containing protein n=1 Tax=Mucilaginibacter rivuli TaxID=2857527 RepID=UPI001C5E39E5|nr:DUF3659 domain-containing protein [Mucilaginibacter rivuli]MBW4890634.1 DUF3659 domain-containing protein [Mucilaginibacter rivuli]
MKKLSHIVALVILFIVAIATGTSAQNVTTFKKGGIYAQNGTQLGTVDKDDVIRNAKGQAMYFIDESGNVANEKGEILGKAKKNGSYYKLTGGNVVLTEDKNHVQCAMLDPKGHNVGADHNNVKLHNCAIHCVALIKAKEADAKKQTDSHKQ